MTEEKKPLNNTHTFGLLGRNISYSFSRGYFSEKFSELELRNHFYINFDIDTIDKFPSLLSNSKDKISGINVTIPYKEEILPYLETYFHPNRVVKIVDELFEKVNSL